jgi:hypothetical protein
MSPRRLVPLLALLAACGPEEPPPAVPAPPPAPPAPPTAEAAPAPPPPGVLGAACKADHPFSQGDCAAGLMCGPGPGGYCLSLCALAPSCDGTCAESGKAGEVCLKNCASAADCREGFVCDDAWKVCTLPRFLAPKAPVCAAAPLAKKRFGPAVQLSTARSPGAYNFEPAAAVAADGSVTAVYIAFEKMGDKNPLGTGTLRADGALRRDTTLAFGSENHFDPWMAADASGQLHLVWLGFDGGRAPEKHMVIGHATSPDGAGWSTSGAVDVGADCPDETPGCLDKPMIAIGPDKKDRKKEAVYVAYASEVTGGTRLVRSSDGGRTFSPSVAVGSGAYGDLEVSPDGDVHATFVTMGGGEDGPRPDMYGDKRNAIEYAVSHDGGRTFDKPRRVSGEGESIPFFFSNPHVAVDAKRKLVYVVYPAGSPDGRWDIWLATSSDGGATWWRVKVNDDAPCASHMTPSVAVRPSTGEIHVVWKEDRSGKGGVAYAICKPGGTRCSPNEAVNDQPFAAYSLGRFNPRWLGEYDTLLLDEKRRKLHVVYTATVDEGGKAVSRIFVATRKL